MAAILNFCDKCSEKRVREVKAELERLFHKKQEDVLTCGICGCKTPLKTEPDGDSVVSVSLIETGTKLGENEGMKNEPDLARKVASTSKRDTTEDPDVESGDEFVPSEGPDSDSDAGSNFLDELEVKDPKPSRKKQKKSPARNVADAPKAPGVAKNKAVNKLLTADLNPDFIKEVILEGSLTDKEFACKECKKEFKFNGVMLKKFCRSHLSEHKELKDIPKTFKCSLCEQCFVDYHFFKKHVKDHTDPTYFCCSYPDCCRKFKHKKSRSDHVQLVHKGLDTIRMQQRRKPCTCHICGATLVYGSSLKKHLLRHQEFKAFKCDECGKSFIDKSHLNTHRERHNELKKSMCEICGKTFVSPQELKTHSVTHTDERIYQCEYCPYRAKRLGNLRNHIKNIHTESDPNKCKCKYCGLNFLSATACTKHEKKHQTGVELAEALLKPYRCSECGYRDKKPCKIRAHMRSHTGEKPFKCTYCEKAFTHNGQCKRHMKICKKRNYAGLCSPFVDLPRPSAKDPPSESRHSNTVEKSVVRMDVPGPSAEDLHADAQIPVDQVELPHPSADPRPHAENRLDLPRPSMEYPPVDYLRSVTQNPHKDLLRTGTGTIFFSI